MLRWDSRRASTATVLKRKSKANTEKGNPGKSSLSIYGILLKMTKGTNVKSVWNQNERKQLILTDDHNTFSTTNWVDLTLNRWGQKRTHAKIHPDKGVLVLVVPEITIEKTSSRRCCDSSVRPRSTNDNPPRCTHDFH